MKLSDIMDKLRIAGKLRAELAVLRVSMLVAALDGDVSGEELNEFHRLAGECEGCSEEMIQKAFSETLRAAGYLMLLARVAERAALLDAFIAEADRMLPHISVLGPGGVVDAVDVWREMAASDGDLSDIECAAIDRLSSILIARCNARAKSPLASGFAGCGFSVQ